MFAQNSILNRPVSLFVNNKPQTTPAGDTLFSFLCSPSDALIADYIKHREQWERAGAVKNDRYKHLLAITPAGLFSERKNIELHTFSGFCCLDFDASDNGHLQNWDNLLTDVFPKIPFIAYAGRSFSGNGYFVLIPIEENPERYSDYARALKEVFEKGNLIADKSCSDIARLRFYVPPAPGQFYVNHQAQRYIRATAEPIAAPAPPAPAQPAHIMPKVGGTMRYRYDRVELLIQTIERNRIDITGEYQSEWVRIAFALRSEYGEAGRSLFHRISRFHPEYNPQATDLKFNQCSKPSGRVNIDTLFYIAKQYGVMLKY